MYSQQKKVFWQTVSIKLCSPRQAQPSLRESHFNFPSDSLRTSPTDLLQATPSATPGLGLSLDFLSSTSTFSLDFLPPPSLPPPASPSASTSSQAPPSVATSSQPPLPVFPHRLSPTAGPPLTVVVITDFPLGALSLRHLACRPALPSVGPPARPRLLKASDQGGGASTVAPPPATDSPIAAQPGIHSRQTAFEGRGPELGGGQGQPGEAAAGPLGLYQNRPRRGSARGRTIKSRGRESAP